MVIATELLSPSGLPSAADWVAVGVAAAPETSTAATVVASAELLSPSGRRTIWTRGTRRVQ